MPLISDDVFVDLDEETLLYSERLSLQTVA